jgi:transglutaminase-like putative cysteine protease
MAIDREAPRLEFNLPALVYTLLSYLVALAPPLIFYFVYRADGPLLPVIVAALSVPLLYRIRQRLRESNIRGGRHRLLRMLPGAALLAILAFEALLIVSLVSITSASTYGAWFFYASRQAGSSTVSYYFVIKFLLFSSVASLAVQRGNITGTLAALAFVFLTVFAVIYQTWEPAVGALIMLLYAGISGIRMRRGRMDRSAVMAVVQVGAASLILAVLSFLPLSDAPRTRSLPLAPRIIPNTLFRIWYEFPLAVDIPGFGGFNGTRPIDGRPSMSGVPVFFAESPSNARLHIKTQVFDAYYNSSWYQTQWIRTRSASDGDIEIGERQGLRLSRRLEENQIRLTFVTDFYSSIPYTLETVSIESSIPLGDFAYPGRDAGFVLDLPFPGSAEFVISEGSPDSGLNENSRQRYLDLSEFINQDVYDLAVSLEGSDPEETIANIQQYFFDNYRYTLNYPTVAADRDVVSHFLLESDSGYCVQFASAMTIMLRILGIPSRYVTGFYAVVRDEDGPTEVTGLNAHAWSEAWIEGSGWRTVEATPPMMVDARRSEDFYASYNPYGDYLTARQLAGIMGRDIDPPAPEVPPGYASEEGPRVSLLRAGAIAASALIALGLISALAYLALPRKTRIRVNIAAVSRFSAWKRLPPVERTGWLALLTSLARFGVHPSYHDFPDELMRFLYSDRPGDRESAVRLDRESRRLARRIGLGRL